MNALVPLDLDVLTAQRGNGPIGGRALVFQETSSTSDLLLQMGEAGEPAGTVVFALRQTKGRGRHGRPWDSARDLGLWFSFLLRPQLHSSLSEQLTALTALAVQRMLIREYRLNALIKPPNDIYVSSKKIAGILTEVRTGKSGFAVIGIGINVRQQREDFAPEVRDTATSVREETGRDIALQDAAVAILESLNAVHQRFLDDSGGLLNDYEAETAKFSV